MKKRLEMTNPYGETRKEFIDKYPGIENISEICWYFGVRQEDLAREVRQLIEMKEGKKKNE